MKLHALGRQNGSTLVYHVWQYRGEYIWIWILDGRNRALLVNNVILISHQRALVFGGRIPLQVVNVNASGFSSDCLFLVLSVECAHMATTTR